uniref:Odorant receptor n=2 Tax=Lutzomyia longipalpis TaxID=7200 RepID=A0A3F2ZDH3_LUTLO
MVHQTEEGHSNVEKYNKILKRLDKFGKIVGLDILFRDENTPANFLLKFAITDTTLYVALIIYSTYLFYGDFLKSAFCWTTFGLAFDSVMKFYVFIFYRRDFAKLGRMLKYASLASYATFFCFANTCLTLNNARFGFYLPWWDHMTNFGYAINMLYQNLQMVLVVFHSSQGDGFYLCHMILACARLAALGHQIDLLNRYLVAPNRETLSPRGDEENIDRQLKDILDQHLIHIQYMHRMEKLYSTYSFLLVTSCMLVVVINIFVLISTLWLAGIFLGIACLFKIMAFCVLGSVVSVQDEKIVKKLYNMRWYLMPKDKQKAMLMLLRSAQNPVEPTMMKFKPLNLNTFLNCLNMIYSISAMLFTMTGKYSE